MPGKPQRFRAKYTGNRGRRHKPGEMNGTEARYADELERADKERALITLCIGAGMGTATIIERV